MFAAGLGGPVFQQDGVPVKIKKSEIQLVGLPGPPVAKGHRSVIGLPGLAVGKEKKTAAVKNKGLCNRLYKLYYLYETMGRSHLTIHDIAAELGISASTVSRALNNHPRISEDTKKAVREFAKKHDYQPNIMASSLRQGKSQTVGVVLPRINRNFFSSVIGGMEEILTSAGYHLIICQSHEELNKEIDAVQTLVNARVDAIMLSISMETLNGDHLEQLSGKGTKLLFFDRVIQDQGVGSVVINDRKGAYLSVKHLLDNGYRKIIHVSGSPHIGIYRERRKGYLDAMEEAGIEVQKDWIIEKPVIMKGGEEAYAEAERIPGVDSFFCAGDYLALGVLKSAEAEGKIAPRDLGVTGFGNEPFTAFIKPGLTTVDQRGEEMGRLVAEKFLGCEKENETEGACDNTVLEPELIIRNSSLKQLK